MTRILKFLYPNKIVSFFCLFLISVVFSTPLIFLERTDVSDLVFLSIFYGTFLIIAFFLFLSHGIQLFEKELFKLNVNIKMILPVIGFQLLINVPLDYFFGKQVSRDYSWLYLFMAIGLGPIIEEFVFRGVFLRALLSKYSSKKSILISSIIFALVHLPLQMPGALCLGLYFGYIFTKTKSFSTTAILHIIANLFGILGKQIFLMF
jgi:membrane protease YdiL (CAAX protease family)